MADAHKVTVTLDALRCHREEQLLGSHPYLWPATVFVNKQTAQVSLVSIPESSAHKILKSGMRAGDSAAIDAHAGTMTRFVQEPLDQMVLILTVGLFEDNETPEDAVRAGFRAFNTTLQASIASHLLALASNDPATVEQARDEIAKEVEDAVFSAT
jgi:hypothetical protein